MRPSEFHIFPLYYKEDSLCSHEVCDDGGRKDSYEDGSLQMDYRRCGAREGAEAPAPVYGDYGRDRNCIGG